MKDKTGYASLLTDSRFEAFLWTQFLGAFNANVYRMIVSLVSVRLAAQAAGGAEAVFVVPFLLFSGYAGQLADRFSKTRVLQFTKFFELIALAMGLAALASGRLDMLLPVLFVLATLATFFSPAKYGILPEISGEDNLARANGLLQLTTVAAIVLGTGFGAYLYQRCQARAAALGMVLLGIAVAGALASLHSRKEPAAGVPEPFHWNPFHEILAGSRVILRDPALTFAVLGITWFWSMGALFWWALPLEGKEVLRVSEPQAGFLFAALAAGIGAGGLLAGTFSGRHGELGLAPVGAFFMGVFGILLGRTPSYRHALVFLTGLGFGAGLFAVPLHAWLQAKAGANWKGRILATNNFVNVLGVLCASGILWLLHDKFAWNAGAIILAAGVAMLAGSFLAVAAIPLACFRFVMRCIVGALFSVELTGEENIPAAGAALLVANHITYMDALFVGLATPRTARFMMRRIYYEMPFAGSVFRMLKAVPVEEISPRTITLALRDARSVLEEGHLFALFPEGHITLDGDIHEFKRGFERIVHGLDVPIVPIGIGGVWGHPFSCKGGDAFRSWENIWRPRVTIRVGPPVLGPITPEDLRQMVIALAASEPPDGVPDVLPAELA